MLSVSNIQRFSLQDGPGIRTTVFLKGCSLHCPWCANPENIKYSDEYWFDGEKCVGTEVSCFLNRHCSRNRAISFQKNIYEKELICPIQALSKISIMMSTEEIERIILKDIKYYEKGGGVTFSGGEPLAQLEDLKDILMWLHAKDISAIAESALFVPEDIVKTAISLFDYFYIDMKIVETNKCMELLGGNLAVYLRNLRLIQESQIPYTIRIPMVKNYTLTESNIVNIEKILQELKPEKVEIFKIHSLAAKKYEKLGKKIKEFETVDEGEIILFKERLEKDNLKVDILSY